VASEPFIDHNMHGRLSTRVLIGFDVLLNPHDEGILPLALLQQGARTAKQLWTPQASGILIKPGIAGELEGLWHDFLTTEQ
ncbi:MAG: HNH endonuclease, partial [Bacteroidota bacterium]